MSLVLDVNGLSTCMAHPLTEDTHLREGEAGVFLLTRLVVPTPSEEKPNGVLSPRASRTYPDHHRPECLVLLAQSIRVSAKTRACGSSEPPCSASDDSAHRGGSWLVLLAVSTGSNSRSATIDVQPVVLELHPVHASVGTDAERHHQVADEA